MGWRIQNKSKNCCFECESRTTTCHSTCERYKEYQAERQAELDLKALQHDVDKYYIEKLGKYRRSYSRVNGGK